MFITKKSISRRAVLRGAGAALALPLLESMVPALTALARTPANPKRRLGIVFVPLGERPGFWTPKTVGTDFEFSPILKPPREATGTCVKVVTVVGTWKVRGTMTVVGTRIVMAWMPTDLSCANGAPPNETVPLAVEGKGPVKGLFFSSWPQQELPQLTT